MVSVWGLSCRLQEQQFAVSSKEGEQTQWHRHPSVFYRSQDHSHPVAKAQPSRSRGRKHDCVAMKLWQGIIRVAETRTGQSVMGEPA